jgi:hypothetical protein
MSIRENLNRVWIGVTPRLLFWLSTPRGRLLVASWQRVAILKNNRRTSVIRNFIT